MGVISHNRTCLGTAAMNLTSWVSTGGEEGKQLWMARSLSRVMGPGAEASGTPLSC